MDSTHDIKGDLGDPPAPDTPRHRHSKREEVPRGMDNQRKGRAKAQEQDRGNGK